jgi:hypothetical protein
MSVAVAGMMQGGKSPAIEAKQVDLGTIYQQDLPETRTSPIGRHDRGRPG